MTRLWDVLKKQYAYNQKPTHPERVLYHTLETMGIRYDPQFWVGRYRADAYLPDYNIVIEVDGEYWHSSSKQRAKDARKDKFYKSKGFVVARVPSKVFLSNPTAWVQGIIKRIK